MSEEITYYVVDHLRPVAACVSLDVALEEIRDREQSSPDGRFGILATPYGHDQMLAAWRSAEMKHDRMQRGAA